MRVFLAVVLLCLFVGMPVGERQPLAQEVPKKPNVLFILTDDQAPEDLAGMANVQRLLVNQGTKFSPGFVSTALCCPSRVSFMRGQYAHNHRVLDIMPPEGGYERFIELGLQRSTVATWLNDAGYDTFYAGKYLNGYKGTTYVPPGWDRWFAFSGADSVGAKYTVNENGILRTYTQDQEHDTYYLRDKADTFIRNRAQGAPWFAWVSTHAPHGPLTIAPQFVNSYDSATMPTPPSYNEADVSDKPQSMQNLPLLDSNCSQEGIDCHREVVQYWRDRQEALMSVDVMVKNLIDTLVETGQMERTYIVFSSDNGYLLYRHRVASKGVAYEESQGVPFVVRGPGVAQGVQSDELAANIDLAPTIAEWAGVQAPEYVDGRSLVPILGGTPTTSWREQVLFEGFRGSHSYRSVRTSGETYVEYATGEKEYYDLKADPWQLESAHAAPENASRLAALSEAVSGLEGCVGAGCRAADRECSADLMDNDGDGVVDEPGEPCGDPRPLDTAIDAGPPGITNNTTARFAYSSTKDNSSFQCRLVRPTSAGAFEPCGSGGTSGSKSYTNLTDGHYTFEVKATDASGNVDATPASRSWTVETAKPRVSGTTPANRARGVKRNANVTATFSEKMDLDTLSRSTFQLFKVNSDRSTRRIANVTVKLSTNGLKATLNPYGTSTTLLAKNTRYKAIVTTGAKDKAGNSLDQSPGVSGNQKKVWSFTVGD